MLVAKIARTVFVFGLILVLIIGLWPYAAQYTGQTAAAPSRTPTADIPQEVGGQPPREGEGTPMPTDAPSEEGDNDDDDDNDDGPTGAIIGVVTDLSTGQPGRGIDIQINGMIVRTDSYGKYSLTGLNAGTYVANLMLPGEFTPATDPHELQLHSSDMSYELNLDYYSQEPPASAQADNIADESPSNPDPVQVSPSDGQSTERLASIEGGQSAVKGETASSLQNQPPPAVAVVPGDLPVVWIAPSHINSELNKVGVINIQVANVENFGAFQAEFAFDPDLIQIEAVNVGNFFENSDRDTTPLTTLINNEAGTISLGAFTSGAGIGPSGQGTIVSISFVAKELGLSGVSLSDVRVFNAIGENINVAVVDGRIFVPSCFADLNGDKQVDVGDVQIAAGRSGHQMGDADYIPEYDINSDGVINNIDVAIINKRLSTSCS